MSVFCTIARASELAQAQVLAKGLAAHQPEARLVVGLEGDGDELDALGLETVRLSDLAGGAYRAGARTPGGRRLPDAGPLLLARLLESAGEAVLLAADTAVYGPLTPVLERVREYGVLLVRRVRALPDDRERPDYRDLSKAGIIDDGLVAVSRGTTGEEFLRWWGDRLRDDSSPQRTWLDLAAARWPEAVLDDPGIGVSYWNVHERPLTRAGDTLHVAGEPLRTFRFAGFRPDHPYWLNDIATRISVVDDQLLSGLAGSYAKHLQEAGWRAPRRGIDGLVALGNGVRLDSYVKALWSEAEESGLDFGDPSLPGDADVFCAWMRGPSVAPETEGFTRYLAAAYTGRTDLRAAYPDIAGVDREGFVGWARVHGPHELVRELLESEDSAGEPFGVAVIGYVGETLGIGEAARRYVQSLEATGISVSIRAVVPDLPVEGAEPRRRSGSVAALDHRAEPEPEFNLVVANGDHLDQLVEFYGEGLLEDRPSIGQWAWETDVLPESWHNAFRRLDEIWVTSTFVAENLGRLSPIPVVVVPPAVTAPEVSRERPALLTDNVFTFLFMMDMFSTVQRKNPTGVIEAFMRAFAPGEGPRLLIKTINSEHRREAFEALRWAAGGRSDIQIVDQMLAPSERAALIAGADCYVSLHRSEGFGFPLAEAMLLGTPVIATGFSGNTDFMTPANSWLVDWQPTLVGSGSDVYPANGSWAEPDLEHGALLMRQVWSNPEDREERASRARRDVASGYSPPVVGRIARDRLEFLRSSRSLKEVSPRAAAGSSTGVALAAIERQLGVDLREGVDSGRGGPGAIVRRAALRMMRPYTHHERAVDQAMLEAIRALDLAISDVRARLQTEQRAAPDDAPRSAR